MKTDDILELIRAGYTKEEIMEMEGEPAPAPAPTPAPAPAPDGGAVKEFAGMMQTMLDQFGNRMQTIMQNLNLSGAQQPQQEGVQDIIASVINPPGRNGGKKNA